MKVVLNITPVLYNILHQTIEHVLEDIQQVICQETRLLNSTYNN